MKVLLFGLTVLFAGADPLAFFRNSPQLAQMRQMIQQDPQLLQNFMQDIGQANPALLEVCRSPYCSNCTM